MVAAADVENMIPRKEMNITLSLHAAAAKVSTSERITISCNCKGPQCSGRCRCIKNKVKCSVHCHATEFDCENLSNLQTRTEIALVQHSPVTTTRTTDDTGSELSELDERWLLADEEEEEEEEANGQLEMEATLSRKSQRSRRRKRADTPTSTPPRKTRRTEAQ
jgi:primase-polymerase (primpol)-like protein